MGLRDQSEHFSDIAEDYQTISPIKIVYEDDSILVVSKPGGMLVHRSKESTRDTVFLLQTLRNQLGGRQVAPALSPTSTACHLPLPSNHCPLTIFHQPSSTSYTWLTGWTAPRPA